MYDFILDRFGGVSLLYDRHSFCYLQPGDDANSFLDDVESAGRLPHLPDESQEDYDARIVSVLSRIISAYDIY